MEHGSADTVTNGDFRRQVLALAEGPARTTSLSLQEYLQSLWGLLQPLAGQKVTYGLLARCLEQAFLAPSVPFDEAWLEYREPPDLEDDSADTFAILRQMIWFQIADLHRLAQIGKLDDPHRYLGLRSPTGHSWYNFDPSLFLECAVQSMEEDGFATEADWLDLAILLWLGQIYE